MGYANRQRAKRKHQIALQAAQAEGHADGHAEATLSMRSQVEAAEADGRRLLRKTEKQHRELEKLTWHSQLAQTGYTLVPTAAVLLICAGSLPEDLLDSATGWFGEVPLSKFVPMGGQGETHFHQKRRQYQIPLNGTGAIMNILIWLKKELFVAGYKLCRGAFAITGGSPQYMHKDRGWWHSISVFVCIVSRLVRFGCPGRPDIKVQMQAGDVLIFNGNVWHSGMQNDADSAVLFFYFDMDKFHISKCNTNEDPSQFGFAVMLSEEEWTAFNHERAGDPDELDMRLCKISEVSTFLVQGMTLTSEIGTDQ